MCAESRPRKTARRSRKTASPRSSEAISSTATDPRRAQELFYAAIDAPTQAKTVKLLREAQALDPHHADVNLTLLDLDPKSAPDRLARLREIVADAAAAMGPDAFEEYAGHFWGFLETRPYMRARAALAAELDFAGRPDEAVAEYSAMISLNPGDNQGLRYELLPLLLRLGRVAEAAKLLATFPGEEKYCVVPAWCIVLLRLIEGDESRAAAALKTARKTNPHAEIYLLGKRPLPLPDDLPGSYSPGSAEEAACYAEHIFSAWSVHPSALAWLRAQT